MKCPIGSKTSDLLVEWSQGSTRIAFANECARLAFLDVIFCHQQASADDSAALFSPSGVIVIIVSCVTTLSFWPSTKPRVASHLPFRRMLGTMHSFLRCDWPHSRYKLETVSVRAVDFVVVMPITRGKQSFLPCSHASWFTVALLHGCMASWLQGRPHPYPLYRPTGKGSAPL